MTTLNWDDRHTAIKKSVRGKYIATIFSSIAKDKVAKIHYSAAEEADVLRRLSTAGFRIDYRQGEH